MKINNPIKYLKYYRKYSFFYRNFIMIFLVLFIPFMSILLIYYHNSVDAINKEISTYNEQLIDNLRGVSDNVLTNIQNVGYYLANHDQVAVFSYYGSLPSNGYAQQQLIEEMKGLKLSNKNIDSIWVYSNIENDFLEFNDNIATHSEEVVHQWMNDCIATYGDNSAMIYSTKYNIYPHLISVYVPVLTLRQQVIGAIVINLNFDSLDNILNLSDDYHFFITKDNIILYSNKMDYLTANTTPITDLPTELLKPSTTNHVVQSRDDTWMYSKIDGVSSGVVYYLVNDTSTYASYFNQLPVLIMQYSLVAFMVSFALSYFLALRTTQPIRNLLSLFSSKEDAILDEREEDFLLGQIMNAMTKNDNLQDQLTTRMQLLQSSQLVALQAQINPHFLYNTLENIKWNAMDLTGGDNPTSRSIQDLGKLLRYSLTITPPYVPLSQEIESLNLYLDIVNVGFEKKIQLVWNHEHDLLTEKVPRLLLQPVIENAIQHGLRASSNPCFIYINTTITNDFLTIVIADNGIGMNETQLQEQRERIQNLDVLTDHHIGLLNVAQRIGILYGSNSTLTIDSKENVGTTITISIARNQLHDDSEESETSSNA